MSRKGNTGSASLPPAAGEDRKPISDIDLPFWTSRVRTLSLKPAHSRSIAAIRWQANLGLPPRGIEANSVRRITQRTGMQRVQRPSQQKMDVWLTNFNRRNKR